MTDLEIFGIVDMGNRRSDYQRETEKVAQLQFLTSKKKSELKSSEREIAPKGRWKSSKHGEVWAQNATTHTSQGLAEGAAPTTPN